MRCLRVYEMMLLQKKRSEASQNPGQGHERPRNLHSSGSKPTPPPSSWRGGGTEHELTTERDESER
ncbi:UNVERIFIED_CONTAM: hypothetical protein NCL1_28935 [Trichonephila clavipes]